MQIHQLDITSKESIEKFAIFINKLGQIDILVNNAGYTSGGFVEKIPLVYSFEHKDPCRIIICGIGNQFI